MIKCDRRRSGRGNLNNQLNPKRLEGPRDKELCPKAVKSPIFFVKLSPMSGNSSPGLVMPIGQVASLVHELMEQIGSLVQIVGTLELQV